jgi:hypothetical protein
VYLLLILRWYRILRRCKWFPGFADALYIWMVRCGLHFWSSAGKNDDWMMFLFSSERRHCEDAINMYPLTFPKI